MKPDTLVAMAHFCDECLKLQEDLIGKLSTYATLLKAENDHNRNGDSEGVQRASVASHRAGLEVTEANGAVEDHRDQKHRPGLR
jgi:hypothetical protein